MLINSKYIESIEHMAGTPCHDDRIHFSYVNFFIPAKEAIRIKLNHVHRTILPYSGKLVVRCKIVRTGPLPEGARNDMRWQPINKHIFLKARILVRET